MKYYSLVFIPIFQGCKNLTIQVTNICRTCVISFYQLAIIKTLWLIISVVSPVYIMGQSTLTKDVSQNNRIGHAFKLTFSSFNHAELLFDGETTYILTESQIKIINTALGNKKWKVIFSKKLSPSQNLSDSIKKMRLDSLEDDYTNWCVMITSGNEYLISYSRGKQKKSISLHHYYLKSIDDLVTLFNSLIPIRFHISYLSKETKQDCNP